MILRELIELAESTKSTELTELICVRDLRVCKRLLCSGAFGVDEEVLFEEELRRSKILLNFEMEEEKEEEDLKGRERGDGILTLG